MTQTSLPRKKSLMPIGLAFVVAAAAVAGYYWLTQDRESMLGSKDNAREVRVKITEKPNHVSRWAEQPQPFTSEERVPHEDQRDESDGRGKRVSLQKDDLVMVTTDDEPEKFTERVTKKRAPRSEPAGLDEGTALGSEDSAEPETYSDEPDEPDVEPPKIIAIRFDPKQVPSGTTLSIYVQAMDNSSGVLSLSGMARSPSRSAMLPFGFQRSGNDKSFVGRLAIPDRAEMGRWYVNYLRITDNVHNTKTYGENSPLLMNAYFEVVASESDNVPPEVTAVYLSPLEVDGGGSVRVTVEAEDDKSGIAIIHGLFVSPSKKARLPFACRTDGETGIIYGDVTFPEDAESGEWILQSLRAEDGARNAKTFNRQSDPSMFDGASIYVYTNTSDSQPPTLDDVMIYPTIVAYGETVEITVYASDDISGISTISGGLESPSGKAHIPFTCVYDQRSQAYMAEVMIPMNAEIGLWRVNYIRMTDVARNQISYVHHTNDIVQEAVFEIMQR